MHYNRVLSIPALRQKATRVARTVWPFLQFGTTQGPWVCEKCNQLSQFCDVGVKLNRVYCMNESCDFLRIIDKATKRIMEDDGTVWEYNSRGDKWRVRAR